jgi:hypothetical protein
MYTYATYLDNTAGYCANGVSTYTLRCYYIVYIDLIIILRYWYFTMFYPTDGRDETRAATIAKWPIVRFMKNKRENKTGGVRYYIYVCVCVLTARI